MSATFAAACRARSSPWSLSAPREESLPRQMFRHQASVLNSTWCSARTPRCTRCSAFDTAAPKFRQWTRWRLALAEARIPDVADGECSDARDPHGFAVRRHHRILPSGHSQGVRHRATLLIIGRRQCRRRQPAGQLVAMQRSHSVKAWGGTSPHQNENVAPSAAVALHCLLIGPQPRPVYRSADSQRRMCTCTSGNGRSPRPWTAPSSMP